MHPVLLLKNTGNGNDIYHMLSFRSTIYGAGNKKNGKIEMRGIRITVYRAK